jgi:hypothetical protein
VNTAMGKLKKKVPHSSMDSDSDINGTDDLSCEDINGDVCKVFFLFWIVLPGCFCIQRKHHLYIIIIVLMKIQDMSFKEEKFDKALLKFYMKNVSASCKFECLFFY